MKKKLIGLSILLLVLLLGLSTTSYAKTLSVIDIKNFIVNSYKYNRNQEPPQALFRDIDSRETTWTSWHILTETYENQWLLGYNTETNKIVFWYYTGSQANLQSHFPYRGQGTIYANPSYLTRRRAMYDPVNLLYYEFANDDAELANYRNPVWYFYTDTNIRSGFNQENNSNGTNFKTAGTYTPDLDMFAENYYSNRSVWGVEEHFYNEVTIQGWNVPSYIGDFYQSYFNGYGTSALEDGWSTALFGGLDEYLSAEVDLYRYDRQSNTWYKSMSTSDRVKIYGEDTQSNTFYLYLGITPYWSDSVAILTLHHKTNPLLDYQVLLYLMSDSTVIDSSGYISMTGTINNYNYSGDNGYVNNSNTINNQNDTQSIVDTLTDDSQVDGMLSEFTNGDSDDMANKLGYSPFANPFTSFLQNIFNGIIDALLNDQDVQLNFGFGGRNYYVSSADFTTPANNTFVNLAKWALIFAYIYGVYRFGWLKIQKLSEFDLDKSGSYTTSERPGRITYGEEELPFDML